MKATVLNKYKLLYNSMYTKQLQYGGMCAGYVQGAGYVSDFCSREDVCMS